MDALTLFGLFAVSAMLVCYAFENRSHVRFVVCRFVRSRLCLRFSSGSLAIWSGRGDLVDCRTSTLAYGANIGRPASANREPGDHSHPTAPGKPPMQADVTTAEATPRRRFRPCWRREGARLLTPKRCRCVSCDSRGTRGQRSRAPSSPMMRVPGPTGPISA